MRARWIFVLLSMFTATIAQAGGELTFRLVFTRGIAHAQELVARGSLKDVERVIPQSRSILAARAVVPYGQVVVPSAYPLKELGGGNVEVVIGYVPFAAFGPLARQLESMEWTLGALNNIAESVNEKHT